MKNASKTKFFLCFRPVEGMDQLARDDKEDVHHPKSCGSVKKKEITNRKRRGSNSSQSDGCRDSKGSQNSPTLDSTNKSFSQFKQIRHGKGVSQEYLKRSKHSSSPKSKESLDILKEDSSTIVLNTYGRKWNSGLLYSPSSITPSWSSSISEPSHTELDAESRNRKKIENQKDQERPPFTQKNMDNSGICLLLVSLTVTIFCGKLCAILFTSIWLYSLPRQNIKDIIFRPEFVSNLPERREQCEENKKRVVMVGLLERNQKCQMGKRRTTITI